MSKQFFTHVFLWECGFGCFLRLKNQAFVGITVVGSSPCYWFLGSHDCSCYLHCFTSKFCRLIYILVRLLLLNFAFTLWPSIIWFLCSVAYISSVCSRCFSFFLNKFLCFLYIYRYKQKDNLQFVFCWLVMADWAHRMVKDICQALLTLLRYINMHSYHLWGKPFLS